MTVEPVLLRTVSHPVFDDRDHACGVDARSPVLKSFDVGLHQRAREIDVFSECAADATPARLRRQVCLWRERLLDADGAGLLASDIRKSPHERRVASPPKAECPGPLREPARLAAGANGAPQGTPRLA